MSKNTVQATGARASVAIGEESQWGDAIDPTHRIPFTSESLSASEETLESEAIRGDRGRRDLIPGVLDISGDLSFEQSASGFGMLIRHVLGDYIKAPMCDGGVHARMEVGELVDLGAGTSAALTLAKEHSGGFIEGGGEFAVVDRTGAGDSLTFSDATGSGYSYDSYTRSEQTHVATVSANDADHPDNGANGGTALVMYPIALPGGGYAVPEFNENGGVIELGEDRREVRYLSADSVGSGDPQAVSPAGGAAVATVKLQLDPADVDETGAYVSDGASVIAGDFVFGFAGLAWALAADATAESIPVSKGAWVYEFDTAYNGVFTHHIERGRYLPEGLTVEVDRDAAVFIYTGCKGSSISWSFDTNSIVTATVSLSGQKVHAMANLVEDVLPGLSADGVAGNGVGFILVEDADAFPDPNTRADMDAAEITIRERTGIYYNEKTLVTASDGLGYTEEDRVYKLVLSTAAGVSDASGIENFHPSGSNVDCRTSRRLADTIEGKDAPLTSFESMVYIDGYYEEVLSGEVSLENNLNADKYGLGSRNRLAVVAEQAEVSATLTMEFDDGKHYHRFKSGNFFYLEFKCISEQHDAEIGNTRILPQQYVILPRCKFDGETPQVGDRSFIQSDMPITAIVDDEYETTDLICILVNGLEKDVEA
jgi:hypothetical protein